jgi:toxin ParE1/3/4
LGWRVRWTTPAWDDVEEAARFVARDSPRYAVVLQREAQSAARSLRQFAYRGRVVPERDNERLRELIVGSHRLIYTLVADDEVHVIAFVNGARDLDEFLKRERREPI